VTASAALSMVLMPKGGTVDVSAIVQAILSAAAVAGSAALFELLPGRAGAALDATGGGTTPPLPRVEPVPATARVPTRPRT
jgi:hypothetical protein